eukprot:XP_010647349.1 PREDICTED: uncharacterized protein LOC104878512 [Vitis vinifera]
MSERERSRESASEGVREIDSDGKMHRAENRRKRKTNSFGVESKAFELEMVEKGGTTLTIMESKKGVSSWVRMGLNSVGLLMEGLQQCIKDRRDGNWEKRWKEKGRSFSMVRVYNRAGCFLRVGVVDEVSKRYNICIPKGKGSKGGWTAMVEALCQLGIIADRKVQQEGTRISGRRSPEKVKGRSFVDMVKAWGDKEPSPIRVEVGREEISSNISRLEHCLIGNWNPNNEIGEDLENLGWKMAKAWGLKGKMGIASMGKGRALLEFELAEEARKVHLSGNKVVGGVRLGLERWNPRSGCMEEGEISKEVWVRILGLPVSLWVPSVLRRVGDACGGFLDVDPKTERMEELEWARILIKSDGANTPGSLVIGIEEISYSLSLWWESVPVLRQEEGRKCCLSDRLRGEVSGDVTPRVGSRVKEKVGVGIEVQRQMGDGTCRLLQREGTTERVFSHVGQLWGPDSWVGSAGPSRLKNQAVGPSLNPMGDQLGLRQVSNFGRATVDGLGHLQKGKSSLNQAHVVDNGPLLKIFSPGLTDKNRNVFMEHEFINYRVEEIGRRQQSVPPSQDTDRMLEEEVARYGLDVNLGGLRVQGASSSNSFCFGRSPEKEGYDHSGMQREGAVIGSGSRNPNVEDRIEKRNGCWDLVEINSVEPLGRKLGWMADQTEPQEGSKEDQLNWEESSLVRFSQFLGFSTEGLEVEILNFLDKIRKRKEKIIGKGFLEASRFERELKRLECSVNYEREAKKKGPMKGRGNQKVGVQ